MRRLGRQPFELGALLVGAALFTGIMPALASAETSPADRLAGLIAALGDDDYHRRESAAAELKAIGPRAIDALLTAAETSGDLEIALRARWLVEAIPFEMPHDPPEVAKLLTRFKRRDFADRVQAMHRLLRVDDDGGLEALARVVRLDPSIAGSRVAAALLAREWRADDPAWPGIRSRIEAGLGPSTRPAARFLTALVAFSGTSERSGREAALASAAAALADLRLPAPDDEPLPGSDDGEEGMAVGQTSRIFERCHVRMLAAAGRREEAIAAIAAGITAISEDGDEAAAAECVDALAWAVEAGLPESVEAMFAAPNIAPVSPLVELAIARAERALGREAAAAERFDAALTAAANSGFAERLQAAILLVKWGCTDWAVRAYDAVLADEPAAAEAALTSIMYSEFLHDLERDDEAADCLEKIFTEGKPGDPRNIRGGLLEAMGRDPRATQSRMHYFRSCACARRGDAAGRRAALERALSIYPKDVDALIALDQLSDDSPEQRADVERKIKAALAQIEDEIQAVPNDANGYNEYAWLVANTRGDIEKATRYSKLSLVKSFDNPSYLDTLAHCHAAAGRHAAAVRTQRLAKRQEPHNHTIQRNLLRFEMLEN